MLLASVAVVVALLTGGRLSGLAAPGLRVGWLAFVALALQVCAVYAQQPSWLPRTLLVASHVMLLAVVFFNTRVPGAPLIGAGLLANAAAMLANGGYMPVTPDAVARAGLESLITTTDSGVRILGSKDIVLSAAETRLAILTDTLVMRWPTGTVLSIGDVLLALGVCWFLIAALHGGSSGQPTEQKEQAPL
ncbi:MAG: DUF5317 family protein [Anaerolineae bacterium]